MKKISFALVLALALLVSTMGSASAITNGEPDNGRHPYVGLLVFDVINAQGQQVPSHRCSGALLSPTLVLTAGHCTDGTAPPGSGWMRTSRVIRNIRLAARPRTTARLTPIRIFASAAAMVCPALPLWMWVLSS
jgi:hypothetical protein